MVNKNFILWFKSIGKNDVSFVGGKAANLGEMYSKFPIPDGFCITVSAFEIFLKEDNNFEKIKNFANQIDTNNIKNIEKISLKIKKIITNSKIPKSLEDEIIKNYKKINGFIAVRSSAVAEDQKDASFAGQQATFLNVKGKDLIKSIKECWASFYTSRAIVYREKNGFNHKPKMAVVIQKMIDSKKSGVIFTVNPVNKNKNEIMLEAVFGLGEAIVSGIVTPDCYLIDKKSRIIVQETINDKKLAIIRKNGKNKKIKLGKKSNEKTLNSNELNQLIKISLRIEEYFKMPMDIEWAIDDKVYILQARPVTTL